MTNEELAIEIQQGHTELITELWEKTEKLFVTLCNKWWTIRGERFTECGVTQEDLMQECYFVLIDAVAAYDSGSGYKFTTYIHYPMQSRFNALLGYRNQRRKPLNGSSSIDTPIDGTDDLLLSDAIPDPVSEEPFEQIDHADYVTKLHIDLDTAMQRKLDEQQRNIVYDYYYSAVPKTEIAEKYGISVDKVYRILSNSHNRLSRDLVLRQRYGNEILQNTLYRGTGLSAFKDRGMSAVERSVEILDRFDATPCELYGDELIDTLENQKAIKSTDIN